MSRGILYVVWGSAIQGAIKSCNSTKKLKIPTCIITDTTTVVPNNVFDKVIRVKWKQACDGGKNFIRNSIMYDYTPFDTTLFLDADTLIGPYFLHKVNRIFKKNKNLLACSARFKYYDGKALVFKLGSLAFTITTYFFHNIFIHPWYFFKTLFGYTELCGCNTIVRKEIFDKIGGFKEPPNLLGADKVFSDSLIYLIRKEKRGKIKTLNFISVLTSGRNLKIKRSFKRINQYFTMKKEYYDLAKDIK